MDGNLYTDKLPKNAVAIVGIGLRLPGDIQYLSDFWTALINKRDLLTTIPENRFPNLNQYIDANRTKGKIVTKRGGFIQNIENFDANFFNISPKEAEKLDPQQRLLLETSFEAIEDSGIGLENLYGSNTGVFVGCWISDFEHRLSKLNHDLDVYSTTGSGRYAMSGRLSFFYNLNGPSISVDTACSSSLVATHLATQSILNGECNTALVGASNIILDPFISVGYSRSGLLSKYGSCYFGSNDVDGYVRSEGACVLIIKKLEDAIKDKNNIYALIAGTSTNNDGASDKYMLAPSSLTQEKMIRDAYKKANINTNKVQYIEAHGTGTSAGDPSEINAIWRALSDERTLNDEIIVGSVKTNIGHTESVAGFAGMVKTILSIKNNIIPADLHFYQPNENIQWNEIGIKIPVENTSWNNDEVKIAGINAFGITGTNAHAIIQEAPNIVLDENDVIHRPKYIIPISANDKSALQEYLKLYDDVITAENYINYTKNICFHKANLKERLAISFTNYNELKLSLQNAINNIEDENIQTGFVEDINQKIVFVFPGQGSQWLGMALNLYQTETVFKQTIDECADAFSKYVDWNLIDILNTKDEDLFQQIDIVQPTLVAVEIALAKWWMSLGIQPFAVVGHSMGEVAAAYIANTISLDDAAKIICNRSQLMKRKQGEGAMAYIALSTTETQQLIGDKSNEVAIAVVNSPNSTVISGDTNAIQQIVDLATTKDIFARLIKVDVASHSQQMDSVLNDLNDALIHLDNNNSNIPFYSTVEATLLNGENLDANYWLKNLRNTVQFDKTIQQLIDDGATAFIEMSPNPVLTQAVQENIEFKQSNATTIYSLEKNKNETTILYKNLCVAYSNGVAPNWKKYYGNYYGKIELPNYPWQKEYYWLEDNTTQLQKDTQLSHPFLTQLSFDDTITPTYIYQSAISIETFPFLQDHKIAEAIVFPATGFLEIVNAVVAQSFQLNSFSLHDVSIDKALHLTEDTTTILHTIIQKEIENSYFIKVYSIINDEKIIHSSAILVAQALSEIDRPITNLLEKQTIDKVQHYEHTTTIKLPYGTTFQTIEKIEYNNNIFITDAIINDSEFITHPALLDATLQTILPSVYLKTNQTFVPSKIEKYSIYQKPISNQWTIETQIKSENNQSLVADVFVYENNKLIILFANVEFINIDEQEQKKSSVYYETNWEELEIDKTKSTSDLCFVIHKEHHLLQKIQSLNNIQTIEYTTINDIEYLLQNTTNTNIVFVPNINSFNENNINLNIYDDLLFISKLIIQQNKSQRFWCLTHNANSTTNINPTQYAIQNYMAVLWNEHYELKPSAIDIDDIESINLVPKIIVLATNENNFKIENNQIFVARLNNINIQDEHTTNQLIPITNNSFRVYINEKGLINNLIFEKTNLHHPKANEVILENNALGINFMNLMSVLGIYPGKENGFATLGIECVGKVIAKGNEVNHLDIGDTVFGMAYHTMASHVIANANALRKIPNNITIEDAATIPTVFLTAFYALVELAKINQGDKVLIHAATGGVGLAAIQIAKYYGAEIYATAGTAEKRSYLKNIGINHIYNSRDTDFYNQILADTNNQGIDIVLNSLTGEAMLKSMQLLKSFGRFIEIGKKDIYNNEKLGLFVFNNALSYHMVDLEKMLFEKPEYLGELLQDITQMLNDGDIKPLPKTVFSIQEVKEAFNYLNTSQHIGKVVVINQYDQNLQIEDTNEFIVDSKATYLLSGGYGGLGLSFVNFLFDKGARYFILLGRSGANETAQQQINLLQQKGATIQIIQTDISDLDKINNIINNIEDTVPLKGVFHLAGILDDASIANMTTTQLHNVLSPKLKGAMNLHLATKHVLLDYFVLFSSSSTMFGSPGQANYVLANAFMNGLALYRQQHNLKALSINWGTVSDVGLAAQETNRADRLKAEGIAPLTTNECTHCFEEIATTNLTNIGCFNFDIEKWQNNYSSALHNSFYNNLRDNVIINETNTTTQSFVASLQLLETEEEQLESIEQKIKELVHQVTKINLDKIQTLATFKSFGIDSLMSIQLKNLLEKVFEIPLSVTGFWTYPTIKQYAVFIIGKLNIDNNKIENIKVTTNQVEIVEAVVNNATTNNNNTSTVNVDDELDDLSKLLDDELNAL